MALEWPSQYRKNKIPSWNIPEAILVGDPLLDIMELTRVIGALAVAQQDSDKFWSDAGLAGFDSAKAKVVSAADRYSDFSGGRR